MIRHDLFFLPNPLEQDDLDEAQRRAGLSWKERCEFYEWKRVFWLAFFTLNLGTGAVSILIGNISFPFGAQRGIGTAFYLLNLVFYIINLIGVLSRAILHPEAFKRSFRDPAQALFFPTCLLGTATLYVGTNLYAVPHVGFWLVKTQLVILFIYIALSLTVSCLLQWTLYDQQRELITITPGECLPVFPLMLAGTLGGNTAGHLSDHDAVYVIIISYMLQGCGYLISLQKLSAWMHRNVILGHPSDPRIVPIFFMAAGPPGFTAFAFLTLGDRTRTAFASQGVLSSIPQAGDMLFMASFLFALMFFGQCLWYLSATLVIWVKSLVCRHPAWGMAWWALTFPMVGFFATAGKLGTLLPSATLRWIEVAGTIIVAFFWLINLVCFFASIVGGRLLVPPVRPRPVAPPRAADSMLYEDERRREKRL